MPQKKRKSLSPFGETPGLSSTIGLSSDAMASLRQTYYTPALAPSHTLGDNPKPFLDAIETENAAFAAELKKSDRFRNAQIAGKSGIDVHYFTCLVFTSQDQCLEFIQKIGWEEYTDGTTQYINGITLAKHLGIELSQGYLASGHKQKRKAS